MHRSINSWCKPGQRILRRFTGKALKTNWRHETERTTASRKWQRRRIKFTEMQESFLRNTVAEIVRTNYRTADVFKRYGISYCCGGAIPLAEACLLKNISPDEIVRQLQKVVQTVSLPPNLQYNNWNLDFLVDYIINVHHAYLEEGLPKLETNLLGFVNSHKRQQPHLETILAVFQQLLALLQEGTRQEEEVLFPYIKQLNAAYRRKETYGSLLVKTLRKPLRKADAENSAINRLLEHLRSLTNHYSFPEGACTSHRVIFQQLQELDNDLVQHCHLENNILLPRAIEMETDLLQLSNRC